MIEHRIHPTVDDIFRSLLPEWPTLSRTTVYNTLRALVESGLVESIEIESGNARYDYCPYGTHAHFMCSGCNRVYDIPGLPIPVLGEALPGFRIESGVLNYRGLCPECIASANQP
ncbi:MAG: transcriptional repressor [Muribaculaceae bacterium]|nr:transcriptional repressor [Muribaculaceae bacterium]